MKLCKKCAHDVKDDAVICPYCGASFEKKVEIINEEEVKYQEEPKPEKGPYIDNGLIRGPFYKWISIPLCILLGWLGAHKFYERKYIAGLFYACTFGFFGIGIVLDLIRLIQSPKYYYVTIIPFV